MKLKIKPNDDRIPAVAIAILILAREHLARGETTGLVSAALDEFRGDYDGYKQAHPRRDLASAKDPAALTGPRKRAVFAKLVTAVEATLARIQKNGTRFSSLLELDNYFAASLREFD